MPRVEANVVLYAVDLDELRRWVGLKDERAFLCALDTIRSDEEADWEPEELEALERLLRRMVFEGRLYEGLDRDERYYLTQLLIDIFDEYVDQDSLSEDLPLDRLLKATDELPRESDAAGMARWLVRGRELGGEGVLWGSGPVDDVLSFFGYVTRSEAGRFAEALRSALGRGRSRPSGLLKQMLNAAEECARAELDLVSFVG